MKTIEELRAEVESMRIALEQKGQEIYGSVLRAPSRSQESEYNSMRSAYRDLKFKLSLLEDKEAAKLAKIEKARIKAELKLNPPPKVKKERIVKVEAEAKVEVEKASDAVSTPIKAKVAAKPKKTSKPRPMFAAAHIYDKPKKKKVAEKKKSRPMFAAAYAYDKPKKAETKNTTGVKKTASTKKATVKKAIVKKK